MIKKLMALGVSLCILAGASIPTLAMSDSSSNLENEYIYLSDATSLSGITTINSDDFVTSDYQYNEAIIIVEFSELWEKGDILTAAKNALRNGKYIYIRAPKYEANHSVLKQLFNMGDSGYLEDADDDYFDLRNNTIGYLSFMDSTGNLQFSRLMMDFSAPETGIINAQGIQEFSADIDNDITNAVEFAPTFENEMVLVEDAVSYVGPNLEFEEQSDSADASIEPQAFNYGKEHFFTVYDTVGYSYEGIYYGSATRRMSAFRVSPEATNNTGSPQPAVNSSQTTRWAWMVSIVMSPNYNSDDEVRNYDCTLELLTFPKGTNNATYRQILWDYTPTTSLDGSTTVTCELNGAVSQNPSLGASVGFDMNFKDITVNILNFTSGYGLDYNVFSMRYDVDNFNVYMPSSPAKNTTSFPVGVVTINDGNKNACIQLNSKVAWCTVDFWGTEHWARWTQNDVAWAIPVR